MIRPAELQDIPDLLSLVEELHAATRQPLNIDRSHTAGFLARLIRDGGLCLVVDKGGPCGFLAASVYVTTTSPHPIAWEYGWYCRIGGWGRRLLAEYEAWAREKGCLAVRLSCAVGDERVSSILGREGYSPIDQTWVKLI